MPIIWGYDLLNFDKHGFDAKSSTSGNFLEVKQCSISSKRWGGTWNDTNEEKALAFTKEKLYTVVAIWRGASNLQFMVYGKHKGLGEYLYERVVNRKESSRSTQSVDIAKLIKELDFEIVIPPDKNVNYVYNLIISYNKKLEEFVSKDSIRQL